MLALNLLGTKKIIVYVIVVIILLVIVGWAVVRGRSRT